MEPPSYSTFWQKLDIVARRLIALLATLVLTSYAVALFVEFLSVDGLEVIDFIQIFLFAICLFWLCWGSIVPLFGLASWFFLTKPKRVEGELVGKTALLIPIYNEDPSGVMARIEAMAQGLQKTTLSGLIDIFVLSDTQNMQKVFIEKQNAAILAQKLPAGMAFYYRNREKNIGRKAGNIADFITRSGAGYEYMLVLDADSLMVPETMEEMVRRIEAEPDLALLQTLPTIIGRKTLFGRALQFSSDFYAPVYARGLAALQGREGPFWGHNAIIRVRAFAASCGMPKLPGKPPFGGNVLSHDFVEAALLARAGWQVRLDPDLKGSFEEAPSNVIEFAKRDRRWCQGNLQHIMLLRANGLKLYNRMNFIQGAFGYLASPIWLFFLTASALAPILSDGPVYFPVPGSLFPSIPPSMAAIAITLIQMVVILLLAPKTLIILRASLLHKTKGFGGTIRATFSVLTEILLSSLLAPIHMMFQSRSVFQVLAGIDAGWPATDRDNGALRLQEAFQGTWWMMIVGTIGQILFTFYTDLSSVWALPITIPLILSPLLVWFTSLPSTGLFAKKLGLFLTPSELKTIPVYKAAQEAHKNWPKLEHLTFEKSNDETAAQPAMAVSS